MPEGRPSNVRNTSADVTEGVTVRSIIELQLQQTQPKALRQSQTEGKAARGRDEGKEKEAEEVRIRPPPLHPPPMQSAYLLTSRNL